VCLDVPSTISNFPKAILRSMNLDDSSFMFGGVGRESCDLSHTMSWLSLQNHHPQQHQQQPHLHTLLQRQQNALPCKRVRFGFVAIRNYDITMGDNPAVTGGPPITLDWSYEQIPSLPLQEFETFREANPRAVDSHCLIVSVDDRRTMLKRAGFTENQIQLNESRVLKIQKQRARTRMSFPFHCVEHALRSAGRKLHRSRQSFPISGHQNAIEFSGKYASAATGQNHVTVSTESLTEHDCSVLGMSPW
jgi:hypothetical protein